LLDTVSENVILKRHEIVLGAGANGEQVGLRPYGTNALVAGTSGSGKSTFAIGFLERLIERDHQSCIIDPEGDYQNFEGGVVFGESAKEPLIDEVHNFLEKSRQNAIINLLGVGLDHRPAFFSRSPAVLAELAPANRPAVLDRDR
jgi:hypothetical protein